MSNTVLAVFVSTGIFLCVVGLSLILCKLAILNRFKYKDNKRLYLLLKELGYKINKLKRNVDKSKHHTTLRLTIAFMFAAGLGRNWYEFVQFFLFGYALAMAVTFWIVKAKNETRKNKNLKALAVLFEAVELYMKGGYSLYQSLRLSRPLVPNLQKEIDACLNYWPESPRKALERFKEELKVEEGEILISLLIHMETAGTKNLSGILNREAFSIERLRRLRNESKLSTRPLYLMIYRFLPLISALGIITGPLVYRAYVVLVDAGLLWF